MDDSKYCSPTLAHVLPCSPTPLLLKNALTHTHTSPPPRSFVSGNDVVDVAPLARLPNLKTLWLDYNTRLVDVAPLAALTNLYYLALSSTSVADASAVLAIPKLVVVYLANTNVTTLPPIPTDTSLMYIDLGNTQLRSLGGLKEGVTGYKGKPIKLYLDGTPLCTTSETSESRLPAGWHAQVNCTSRCAPQCPPAWDGDKYCDFARSYDHAPWRRLDCNVPQCGFDSGFCPAWAPGVVYA